VDLSTVAVAVSIANGTAAFVLTLVRLNEHRRRRRRRPPGYRDGGKAAPGEG
jgi:hypothetical protein